MRDYNKPHDEKEIYVLPSLKFQRENVSKLIFPRISHRMLWWERKCEFEGKRQENKKLNENAISHFCLRISCECGIASNDEALEKYRNYVSRKPRFFQISFSSSYCGLMLSDVYVFDFILSSQEKEFQFILSGFFLW